jgi:hypothetical protein
MKLKLDQDKLDKPEPAPDDSRCEKFVVPGMPPMSIKGVKSAGISMAVPPDDEKEEDGEKEQPDNPEEE